MPRRDSSPVSSLVVKSSRSAGVWCAPGMMAVLQALFTISRRAASNGSANAMRAATLKESDHAAALSAGVGGSILGRPAGIVAADGDAGDTPVH